MVDAERLKGFRTPDTNAEAVLELARHDTLPSELAERVARAVGFRNLLVHRYADIVDAKVVEQLEHLDALESFVQALTDRYL
jgi:uncharacterized protein YutE (UPF0331/DUF86 family)